MAIVHNKSITIITAGLVGGDNVVLMPGINEIDDHLVTKFKAHPSIRSRVKDGKIQIIENVKVDEEGQKPVADDMSEYIPQIYDMKLLRKIVKEDDRPDVVQAARNQIEMILQDKKEAKKQENDHFQ